MGLCRMPRSLGCSQNGHRWQVLGKEVSTSETPELACVPCLQTPSLLG